MKFLTFEQIKAQLRLDDEQAEMERLRLESYAEAAEEAVLELIRRSLPNVVLTFRGIPQRLVNAALLLVDEWYQHRATVNPGQLYAVPYAFDFMLKPLMRLSGDDENINATWEEVLPAGALVTADGYAIVDRDYKIVTSKKA